MSISLKAAFIALLLAPMAADAGTPEPMVLNWGQLVPTTQAPAPAQSKGFLAGARPPTGGPNGEEFAPPPPTPEAGWMSSRSQQPGGYAAPAIVPELDGQRVRIGGYVVPLDFDATKVREFLLVPFVGACIHVPPPPPNQIIYVKAADAFEVAGQFDPVYVTGTLKTARQLTGLAATGYTIEAAEVETRKE
jgi:hypothetical protein